MTTKGSGAIMFIRISNIVSVEGVEKPLVTTTLPKVVFTTKGFLPGIILPDLVVIEIKAGLDNAHFGHFQMELCAQEQETDNCFNLLPVVSASQPLRGEYQVCIPFDNPAPPNDIVTVRLQLPAGVRCSRCTLRWTYRTSYPNGASDWDECYTSAPAQTFRNCVDISIN
ncbi:uncharacterized protein LOC110859027 [Folsomia candida]|uniref:uncharacterized protein LOC110859027 n=1 Tax=Folsomia candida TaxID=158441 RepID=UPI0016055007|nr:uncharacterized protein LOC110859027 [Folsomia candida]